MSIEVDWPSSQRSVPVAVEVNADHAPGFREPGKNGPVHARRPQSSVQQQQWFTFAVDFEPVVHAVRGHVAARIRPGRFLGARQRRNRDGEGGSSQSDSGMGLHRGSPVPGFSPALPKRRTEDREFDKPAWAWSMIAEAGDSGVGPRALQTFPPLAHLME
jgi:hypothetical protein